MFVEEKLRGVESKKYEPVNERPRLLDELQNLIQVLGEIVFPLCHEPPHLFPLSQIHLLENPKITLHHSSKWIVEKVSFS